MYTDAEFLIILVPVSSDISILATALTINEVSSGLNRGPVPSSLGGGGGSFIRIGVLVASLLAKLYSPYH